MAFKDKFGKIDKVYMTGKTWDKDIEKFKVLQQNIGVSKLEDNYGNQT